MNGVQEHALRTAIRNEQDNLARFRAQQVRMPDWVSGNGNSIAGIISELEYYIEQLSEGVHVIADR